MIQTTKKTTCAFRNICKVYYEIENGPSWFVGSVQNTRSVFYTNAKENEIQFNTNFLVRTHILHTFQYRCALQMYAEFHVQQ